MGCKKNSMLLKSRLWQANLIAIPQYAHLGVGEDRCASNRVLSDRANVRIQSKIQPWSGIV